MGRRDARGGSVMTQKECLLLEWVRGAFEGLGKPAIQLMESIVLYEERRKADAAARRRHPQTAMAKGLMGMPAGSISALSLRGIERFFKRIENNDGEAAFWCIRRTDPPAPAQVTAATSAGSETMGMGWTSVGLASVVGSGVVGSGVCEGDVLYRNDYHVYPTHVFSSQKRATTCWQKRYVDCFGRRVPAAGWPFPSTVCQVIAFWWMLTERILERLRLLSAVPDPRGTAPGVGQPKVPRKRKTAPSETPRFSSPTTGLRGDDAAEKLEMAKERKAAKSKKLRDIFVFDYPFYVPRPPIEGAAPEDPTTPLPLLCADREVVEQYYAQLVDKLLFQDAEPSGPVVELETVDVPLLSPRLTEEDHDWACVGQINDSDNATAEDMMLLSDLATLSSYNPKKKKPKKTTTAAAAAAASATASAKLVTTVGGPEGYYAEPSGPTFPVDGEGLPLFLLPGFSAHTTVKCEYDVGFRCKSEADDRIVSSSKMAIDFGAPDESDATAHVELD